MWTVSAELGLLSARGVFAQAVEVTAERTHEELWTEKWSPKDVHVPISRVHECEDIWQRRIRVADGTKLII